MKVIRRGKLILFSVATLGKLIGLTTPLNLIMSCLRKRIDGEIEHPHQEKHLWNTAHHFLQPQFTRREQC